MFGVTFLYPLFLVAAVAAIIPLALHLFRRKTEAVIDFPAVRLLEQAPVERQRRRRLRELLLLALRMSALGLLALAFARPYLASATTSVPAPVTIIALDTSLSLSAPGQFDAARRAARRAVDNAPATHTVGLVTFADAATLVVAPTTDRGGVLAAIDQTSITAGGTRFRTALARAAEAVRGAGSRIVVISDLQRAGWEAGDEGAVPDSVVVEVVAIAAPASNVAITAARRERDAIVAGIHNYGAQPARVRVRLRLGDREVVAHTIEVAGQAATDVRLVATLGARGGAEVRIDDDIGYQADNSRFVVLEPPTAVPVFVITADPPGSSAAGFYIERALSVADEGGAFDVRVADGRAFSALSPQQFNDPGAIVLLGTSTLDRIGRARVANYLRGGGRVLLTLGPDIDAATLGDIVGTDVSIAAEPTNPNTRTVTLVAVDGRHPIFRPFSNPTGALGDVYVERYRRLNDQPGRTVLARFSG
ncbi:MAG: VWA domain-containing protein, partial [Acidobacteria bacterium]|nr:VWA domain-containing protein [Acidobacteriota bacterium]